MTISVIIDTDSQSTYLSSLTNEFIVTFLLSKMADVL